LKTTGHATECASRDAVNDNAINDNAINNNAINNNGSLWAMRGRGIAAHICATSAKKNAKASG
jgi:hypothetical protein